MWRGFDTALHDEVITWQGIWESLFTRRKLLGVILGVPGMALVMHFIF